jgi:putative solute:sodium symporter small subunit
MIAFSRDGLTAALGRRALTTAVTAERAAGQEVEEFTLSKHYRIEGAAGFGRKRMQQTNDEAHWQKTTNLMLIHLGVWFFFGFIIHMFVKPLNTIVIPILGFPLGFYMAAQGSLIVFVVMLFLFAKQQDKIDREFGVAEDD